MNARISNNRLKSKTLDNTQESLFQSNFLIWEVGTREVYCITQFVSNRVVLSDAKSKWIQTMCAVRSLRSQCNYQQAEVNKNSCLLWTVRGKTGDSKALLKSWGTKNWLNKTFESCNDGPHLICINVFLLSMIDPRVYIYIWPYNAETKCH